MSINIFQLQKRSSYTFKGIQDKFSFNEKEQVVAIADGTTQSLRSELWAEIITKEFASNPVFEKKHFIDLIKFSETKFRQIDYTFNINPAKAALEKQKLLSGATSTFLGIKLHNDHIESISCGDSNVFLLNEKGDIDTFPFNNLDELDKNKDFLNTNNLNLLEEGNLYYNKIPLSRNNKIILCTDAFSRLLLSNFSLINEVLKFNKFDDFLNFCISNWDNKSLQEDDITLIIIDKIGGIKPNIFLPDPDFEFEREKEYEFIPTPINEEDMSKNHDLINSIKTEFAKINKKITKLETLIMILIIVCFANFVITIYSSFGSTFSSSNNHEIEHTSVKESIKDKNSKVSVVKNEEVKKEENQFKESNIKNNTNKATNNSLKKDSSKMVKPKLKDSVKAKQKVVIKDTIKKNI